MMKSLWRVWSEYLAFSRNRAILAGSVLFLGVTMGFFKPVLVFVETRPGGFIPDPILSQFSPIDLTWLIFAILYVGLTLGFALLLRTPERLLAGLRAYALMVCVRMVMMYTLPLEPPMGAIPLIDPLVSALGNVGTPTRDLFFSGHTATMAVLMFSAHDQWARRLFGVAMTVMASAVVLQHVHYTVDVLVAPFVSYLCWRVAFGVSSNAKSAGSRAE